MWRSPVAHYAGGVGVAGSNPVIPTSKWPPLWGLFAGRDTPDTESRRRFDPKGKASKGEATKEFSLNPVIPTKSKAPFMGVFDLVGILRVQPAVGRFDKKLNELASLGFYNFALAK